MTVREAVGSLLTASSFCGGRRPVPVDEGCFAIKEVADAKRAVLGSKPLPLQDRFRALNTARTEANSMFVSTPAPQRVRPSGCLI